MRRPQRRRTRRARTVEESESSESESDAPVEDDLNAHLRYSILGPEKRRRYKQLFQNIDVNGDGTLSVGELETSLSAVNKSWGSVDAGNEQQIFVKTLLRVQKDAVNAGLDFKTFCIVLALSEQAEGLELLLESSHEKLGPKAFTSKVQKANVRSLYTL